jgi:hypothetical protein
LRDYSRCGCAIRKADFQSRPFGSFTDSSGERGDLGCGQYSKPPNPLCPICHGKGKIAGTERQLGLEPTPEQYIANMTAVFHEVKRVLRKDGTCWVNMGDCYAGSGKGYGSDHGKAVITDGDISKTDWDKVRLAAKQLVGQPWRLAFALQADGWYLRSDIIWAKPNPMPESVTDRPTRAHEYIFLLSKSPRYFYDQEAVREKSGVSGGYVWTKSAYEGKDLINNFMETNPIRTEERTGRNSRTVWEIAIQPYPEAHFATFPEELPRRCIKAGTSEKGCCPKCGASWERILEKKPGTMNIQISSCKTMVKKEAKKDDNGGESA